MSLRCREGISIRNQWARQHAEIGIRELTSRVPGFPPIPVTGRLPEPDDEHLSLNFQRDLSGSHWRFPRKKIFNIGIVGAGAAGLFTGLTFDYLNKELHKLGIKVEFKYQIFESASEDRLGGRLYTYNFGGERDCHDYYDVGAMRFPDHPIMKRTFDLFDWLGMEKTNLHDNPHAKDGSIIPYYMVNKDKVEPWCYNNITLWGDSYIDISLRDAHHDPFKMSTDGSIPPDILINSPDQVLKSAIEPLRRALENDEEQHPPGHEGWDILMHYDKYSTRQFFVCPPPFPSNETTHIRPPPYNYQTVEWMETFNGGTDWYDQAFSETVLESLDFEYYPVTDWYCILGGAQQLAIKMNEKLRHKPQFESPVTAIRAVGVMQVELDVLPANQQKISHKFNGIFNTTSLGCLKRMDLIDAGLNYATIQAIRSLQYGPAAKVAIKFKRAWWIHDLGEYCVTGGGLGHSDLSIRTCVYPSYNIYDDEDKTAVLLCSYTWQQDARRISSLMSTNPNHEQAVLEEADLKELLLRDLARLHRNENMNEDQLYNLIKENYVDHHAFDWDKDPNTAGAFAFFRPQQFTNMWNKMIHPSGDVVIVGEAMSPHHAWVVGALESVVHGIHAWLGVNQRNVPEFAIAKEILETAPESGHNPFWGLPPYMDVNISKWHSVLGMIHREHHLQRRRGNGTDSH